MGWVSTIKSASTENWRSASREVLSIAGISLIPLIFRAIFFYLDAQRGDKPITFVDSILTYVLSGDLLFFSISNFAAILWISSQDFEDRFVERIYFIIFCVLGLVTSTFILGFDATLQGIPVGILRAVSILSFAISILVNILLVVFHQYSGVDFSKSQTAGEDVTSEALAKRKGAA